MISLIKIKFLFFFVFILSVFFWYETIEAADSDIRFTIGSESVCMENDKKPLKGGESNQKVNLQTAAGQQGSLFGSLDLTPEESDLAFYRKVEEKRAALQKKRIAPASPGKKLIRQPEKKAVQPVKGKLVAAEAAVQPVKPAEPAKPATRKVEIYTPYSYSLDCETTYYYYHADWPEGSGTGLTCTGNSCVPWYTVAVDPEVIPLGSRLVIDGCEYLADDVGGAINGNKIDIAVWSRDEAFSMGRRYNHVEVYPPGGGGSYSVKEIPAELASQQSYLNSLGAVVRLLD